MFVFELLAALPIRVSIGKPRGVMKSDWTEEKIQRWRKEGRGQGSGPHYRPWLTNHDVSSTGRAQRPYSQKFGRHFELLSDIEYRVFLLAERGINVVGAEEQRPISREITQAVAQKIGARHPYYPYTHVPCVMTVDLLLIVQGVGEQHKIGIDCKAHTDAEDPRVVEKLEITRVALAERGHRHLVVFDKQLPMTLISNLESIRAARAHEEEKLPYEGYLEHAVERFRNYIITRTFGAKPLRTVCQEFDATMSFEVGTGFRAARLLIDQRLIDADLNLARLPDLPMSAFCPREVPTDSCWGIL